VIHPAARNNRITRTRSVNDLTRGLRTLQYSTGIGRLALKF
jgi:hypothetical protein